MNARVGQVFALAREYKFVTGCVVVAVLGAVTAFFFYRTLGQLEGQQARARDDGMAVQKILASANSLRSDRAYIEAAMKDIDDNLITEENLADNVGYFYKIEEQTHAHISDLRPQPSLAANPDIRFKVVPVSFNVTGTYAQVIAFVHQIEHGPRLMRITGFGIRRRPPPSGQTSTGMITMDLSLEMLGRP